VGSDRRKHYSIRTEQAYVDWIRRFVLHHNKSTPGHGGGGSRGVPDPLGGGEAGVGLDAEPGQGCGPIPLQGEIPTNRVIELGTQVEI
jgi:hypothetical protein